MKQTQPPWGSVRKVPKRSDKKNPGKITMHEISFQPKGLTKGLKRQIRKYLDQNPREAERQMAILGVTRSEINKKARR